MPETQLTLKQAYLAMYAFLAQTQQTFDSDDLADLLSDLSLLPDGSTADPACWGEWEEAVERALRDPALANLVLFKK